MQVAQGDLAAALQSYRDSLAIIERLAKSDTGNAVWQRDLSLSYERIGNVQLAQSDLAGALASYREGLAIRERLAKSDPGNADWQSDLWVSYDKIGNVQLAQGDLAGALKSYRDNLAIIERLAKSDPGNANWQRDLAVSYGKVGDRAEAQGDAAGGAAILPRRASPSIERLAQSDPGNAGWQRDLAVSYEKIGDIAGGAGRPRGCAQFLPAISPFPTGWRNPIPAMPTGNMTWQLPYQKIGDVQMAQGDLAAALRSYRESLERMQRLVSLDRSNKQWREDLDLVVARIGGEAFAFVLASDFATALEAADQAIALAPDEIWFRINRAHALMFLGRVEAARALYLKYRGRKDVLDGESWEAVTIGDFATLRKAGLSRSAHG